MDDQKEKDESVEVNEYRGYSLFKDVEDVELRDRNRAQVLWNIFESNSENGNATVKGMAYLVGYTNQIPEAERRPMITQFTLMLHQGGTV